MSEWLGHTRTVCVPSVPSKMIVSGVCSQTWGVNQEWGPNAISRSFLCHLKPAVAHRRRSGSWRPAATTRGARGRSSSRATFAAAPPCRRSVSCSCLQHTCLQLFSVADLPLLFFVRLVTVPIAILTHRCPLFCIGESPRLPQWHTVRALREQPLQCHPQGDCCVHFTLTEAAMCKSS